MNITIVYAPEPRRVLQRALEVPENTSLMLAIEKSGVLAEWHLINCLTSDDRPALSLAFGVWNERIKNPAEHILQEGDRVEIYRALRVDPMVARRERFQKQGARSAGLFAKRRPGAKPGY